MEEENRSTIKIYQIVILVLLFIVLLVIYICCAKNKSCPEYYPLLENIPHEELDVGRVYKYENATVMSGEIVSGEIMTSVLSIGDKEVFKLVNDVNELIHDQKNMSQNKVSGCLIIPPEAAYLKVDYDSEMYDVLRKQNNWNFSEFEMCAWKEVNNNREIFRFFIDLDGLRVLCEGENLKSGSPECKVIFWE